MLALLQPGYPAPEFPKLLALLFQPNVKATHASDGVANQAEDHHNEQ
jgi:hypothetical protein